MQKKVFVGSIAWATTEENLAHALGGMFGTVTEAKIIMDRDTNRSKGFGFVTFEDAESADEAVKKGGMELDGRTIRIDWANERKRDNNGPKRERTNNG